MRPLHERLCRHAAQIGAIAAAGEWSQPGFRQCVAPVLVAVARRIDGLPSPERGVADAGIGGLIAQGLRACRSLPIPSSDDRERAAAHQVRELAAALAIECARIQGHWMAVDAHGRRLDSGSEPLSARAARLGLSHYVAISTPPDPLAGRADRAGAALAWLVRDLPACALAMMLGDPAEDLPRLLRQVRDSPPASTVSRCVEADAMTDLVREGHWQVNRRKGRLWWLDQRLYLAWRTGARELAGRCGPPAPEALDPEQLLTRLHRCGLVRDRVQLISTPWTPSLEAVELCDPLYWLAAVACADPAMASAGPARRPNS